LNRRRSLIEEIAAALLSIKASVEEDDEEDDETADAASAANTRVEALNALHKI
jgi:hypothetical protein